MNVGRDSHNVHYRFLDDEECFLEVTDHMNYDNNCLYFQVQPKEGDEDALMYEMKLEEIKNLNKLLTKFLSRV